MSKNLISKNPHLHNSTLYLSHYWHFSDHSFTRYYLHSVIKTHFIVCIIFDVKIYRIKFYGRGNRFPNFTIITQ